MNIFLAGFQYQHISSSQCFKCIQLQQETQAVDGVVAFITWLQTQHTHTHFADILTRLSKS